MPELSGTVTLVAALKLGFIAKGSLKKIKYSLNVEWNMHRKQKRKDKHFSYSVIHFEGEII